MAVRGTALADGMSVNGGYVPFEFGVLARTSVDCELRVEDQLFVTCGAVFRRLPKRCDDKLCIRSLKFPSQGFDKVYKVLFVLKRMPFVVAILVTLPPGKALDRVASSFPVRELPVKVVQHFVSSTKAVVILFAGVPVDRLWIGTFFPGQRRFFIGRVNLSAVLESLAARGKEIPGK